MYAGTLHYTICYRITWIQIQGTKYVEGSIVVRNSPEVLPTFGIIINILLITLDEPYLVCEVLRTQEFLLIYMLLSFKETSQFLLFSASLMNCQIGLYTFQDTHATQYIVPQYHLM